MPCIRDPAVQQAIADAYIENGGNKEQAVIAAGYSERYARGNASKLVAISGVQEKSTQEIESWSNRVLPT